MSASAHAATFNIPAGNVAALKNAIHTANGNIQPDTINLAANSTYNLKNADNSTVGINGLPLITNDVSGSDLTINGNGATLSRSTLVGTPAFRILQITDSATVTILGLTFNNGSAADTNGNGNTDDNGGAILVTGGADLTLNTCNFFNNAADNDDGGATNVSSPYQPATFRANDCSFASNYAFAGGAICNNGLFGADATTILTNCTLSNNQSNAEGGAILNEGTFGKANLTMAGCTLSHNATQGSGGALYLIGQQGESNATLKGCTLSDNTAPYSGGGIACFGNGERGNTSLMLTNCTLSDNSTLVAWNSPGGAIYNNGSMQGHAEVSLTSCTLSGNVAGLGGGLYNIGNEEGAGVATVHIGNTIFKTGFAGANFLNVGGTVVSQGYNLSSDNGAGFLTATGDQINTDPKLGSLAYNGGLTATHALLGGSPARDKGEDISATGKDQRGEERPYNNLALPNAAGGDGSDIGAFEVQFEPATLAVNNPRSLPEGGAASPGSVTFDITLNVPTPQTVTVHYQTTNGINNPAIAGSDYVAKSGNLTFAPGDTIKRVTIFFIGDSVPELNETFFLDLKTPVNATIADSRGVGQINNDDGPSLNILDAVPVDEGIAALLDKSSACA